MALLRLTYFRTDPQSIEIEGIDLYRAVENAVSHTKDLGDEIAISDNVSTAPQVLADWRIFSAILLELCSNAVQHSTDSSSARVYVDEINDEFVSLAIENKTAALAGDELDQLFRAGFRGSAAVNHRVHGSGLGLTRAEELSQLIGLQIEVTTRGSLFIVKLRLSRS